MKAQFKYTFINGLYMRGITFMVIFTMNAVFILLGSLGLLPFAANVVAVSLGGIAIAVMFAANLVGDISIGRRMYHTPDAYLNILAPIPRWKILFTGVTTMAAMDIITMAIVIFQEVWLSLILAGTAGIREIIFWAIRENPAEAVYVLWGILILIAGYLLVLMVIMFCVTVKKSIFYKIPASGLLTFLLACGCVYILSLMQLVFIPFGSVQRYGIFIIIEMTGTAFLPVAFSMILLGAAALFLITSKLMERKINL